MDNLWISSRAGRRAPFANSQTPHNKITVFCGFLFEPQDAPGAPGVPDQRGDKLRLDFRHFILPGVLTSGSRKVILTGWQELPGIRKEKNGLNAWITYTIKVGVGPRHSILRTGDDLLTPPNSQTPQMNSCLMIRGAGSGTHRARPDISGWKCYPQDC